jgi:hypothetical protein
VTRAAMSIRCTTLALHEQGLGTRQVPNRQGDVARHEILLVIECDDLRPALSQKVLLKIRRNVDGAAQFSSTTARSPTSVRLPLNLPYPYLQ